MREAGAAGREGMGAAEEDGGGGREGRTEAGRHGGGYGEQGADRCGSVRADELTALLWSGRDWAGDIWVALFRIFLNSAGAGRVWHNWPVRWDQLSTTCRLAVEALGLRVNPLVSHPLPVVCSRELIWESEPSLTC